MDNLIDSAMVKCELSVLKKRENAIDTLRLRELRPDRVNEEIEVGESNLDSAARTCMRGPTAKQVFKFHGKPFINKKTRKQSYTRGTRTLERMRELKKKRPPEPPWFNIKPPPGDVNGESHESSLIGLKIEGENEERLLTPKTNTSQNSSTSAITNRFLLPRPNGNKNKLEAGASDQGDVI